MKNPNRPLAPRSKRDTGKATAFFEAHLREKSNARETGQYFVTAAPAQAEGGAEDQNDNKTVDGREKAKTFSTHKFS
jgi:hypothetical protein